MFQTSSITTCRKGEKQGGQEMKTEDKKIICNCCGKVIGEKAGIPREEFLHVEKEWGYFSGKDGEIQEFDICETCYDKWVKNFQIPVRTIEVTEFV